MPVTPESAFDAALSFLSRRAPPPAMGVAVSGGSDSTALLHLAADWAGRTGAALSVATVDHGLRPEAAAEAEAVAGQCRTLGLQHRTLVWTGWDGQGNLQAEARAARRALLSGWAAEAGLSHVLLGHTADDQAETFLLRLARGSGVDGLSCMEAGGAATLFLRPLLALRRDDLRDWLRARGLDWIDDPSNENPRFDRVKARNMLDILAPLGLSVERLVETTAHMARGRAVLRQAAAEFARAEVTSVGGDLLFSPRALRLAEGDSAGRVLAAAVQWVGRSPYRPRFDALCAAALAVAGGETRTLGGVRIDPDGQGGARLAREAAAAVESVTLPDGMAFPATWDGRWHVEPISDPGPGPWQIAALGEEGLRQCPDWRSAGFPRSSLLSTPAVWKDGMLIAAPLAGKPGQWRARLGEEFGSFILSH